MDFAFSEHHELLRKTVRDFARARGRAPRAQMGRGRALPEGDRPEARRARPARHPHPRGVRRLGHGHDELRDLRRGDRARRRLARAHGRVAQRARHGAHPLVRQRGAEEEVPAEGRDAASGSRRGRSPSPAAAATRPASRTTARRDGDDWVINGTKMFITQGSVGGFCVVLARTNPDVAQAEGHHRVRRRARHAGLHSRRSTWRSSAAARATRASSRSRTCASRTSSASARSTTASSTR